MTRTAPSRTGYIKTQNKIELRKLRTKYDALKKSHEKLVEAGMGALDFIGFPADAKALGLKPIPQAVKLEQALEEAEKLK